jgi:hypothetical protein
MYPRGEASGARGVQHCPLPRLELRRLDRGQPETKRPALPTENMHRRAKFFMLTIFFSVLVQQKVWWRGLQPAGQMSGPPGPEPARSSGESFVDGISSSRAGAASIWTKICQING